MGGFLRSMGEGKQRKTPKDCNERLTMSVWAMGRWMITSATGFTSDCANPVARLVLGMRVLVDPSIHSTYR